MEVISNKDGFELEDIAIGKWMHEYIWQRDEGICQICEQSATQTEHNPLVVERKDLSLPSRAANLWLVHYDCHEEHQSRAPKCKALRLEPRDIRQPAPPQRPKYWTARRVLALLVLLIDIALCFGCILFYRWCFRVLWP